MPLFIYHCLNCGEDFEKVVRFMDLEKPVECPHCKSSKTEKQVSTFPGMAKEGLTVISEQSACRETETGFR